MKDLIHPFGTEFEDYRRDESRRMGNMSGISFPTTEDEVVEVLVTSSRRGESITVQGARTGIVAGAVPQGGVVLNMSRMAEIGTPVMDESGAYSVTVQPGAILSDLRDVVAMDGLFFPPDPTETSASIGGMVSCNASGAMTFHYGPTRDWVRALRVVLIDGDILSVRRGEVHAEGRSFALKTLSGRTISGELPNYEMPQVKTSAGYFASKDMDLLDLFIGMEGTLGVITEIELKLMRKPRFIYGVTVFLPCEKSSIDLVRILRGEPVEGFSVSMYEPVAIEFFNKDALDLLRRMKIENPAFEKIPSIPPGYRSAVYVEFHGDDESVLDDIVMELTEVIAALGGSDEDTWFASNDRKLERLKEFRHATPEAVNLLIDGRKREIPGLTKLGTDMSVPDSHLEAVLEMYDSGLRGAGLESVIFGHIGNNHLHVNILPRNMDEYDIGKALYLGWAKKVVEMGGSVSAEHGIGKLKLPFLRLMYGEDGIAEMRALRAVFDPCGKLNEGNLF
jgi:D-lactate dehydrogenase (cytochrome)